jgi:hypothetical protein
MASIQRIQLNPSHRVPLLKDQRAADLASLPQSLPIKQTYTHPRKSAGQENASIFFVGTATTILEWEGIRVMTDPNFLPTTSTSLWRKA